MISFLISAALVAAVLLLAVYLPRLGKVKYFSAGVGNALFHVDTLLRPSRQQIIEARRQKMKEEAKGDDGPPDLPPWASGGS